MANKEKDKNTGSDEVVDLAARIGARPPDPPAPAPPPKAPETPPGRLDGPLPPRRSAERGDADATEEEKSAAIPSPRMPPGPGETDIVITPLPTLDDWHRFELALRKVRGVGQVKTEYYRHAVLKVRVTFEGPGRLSQALRAGVPGYRVRIIGEDASTLQILVSSESDERRPG